MSLHEISKRAAALASRAGFVRLDVRNTSDGILAAAVLAKALSRAGVAYHAGFRGGADPAPRGGPCFRLDHPPSDPRDVEGLSEEEVLLHHGRPLGEPRAGLQLHPRLGGYDGAEEACTASLAALVARYLAPEAVDLALPLAGAYASRQHLPALSGLNAVLRDEATGVGRAPAVLASPTPEALAAILDPFVGGITGRARQAKALLDELQIPSPCPEPDARRLASRIALRLLQQGASARGAAALATPRLTLRGESLEEVAFRVEAARALAGPDVAFAAALGDPLASESSRGHAERARMELLQSLLRFDAASLSREGGIVHYEDRGPLALLRSGVISDSLVADPLAVVTGAGIVVRARPEHLQAGWSAVLAARDAARGTGGSAAGHDLEALAFIPEGAKDVFLRSLAAGWKP